MEDARKMPLPFDFFVKYLGKPLAELTGEEKAAWDADIMAHEEAAVRRERYEAFRHCGATARQCAMAGFEKFTALQPQQNEVLNLCLTFLGEILAGGDNILTLSGRSGCGKTYFALSLLKEFYRSERPPLFVTAADGGRVNTNVCWYRSGIFVSSDMLCDYLGNRLAMSRGVGKHSAIGMFGRADLLVIDEVGRAQCQTQTEMRAVFSIIERRINEGLPTVLTTNYSTDEMERNFGAALMSRLHADGNIVVEMTGIRDMRSKKSREEMRQVHESAPLFAVSGGGPGPDPFTAGIPF